MEGQREWGIVPFYPASRKLSGTIFWRETSGTSCLCWGVGCWFAAVDTLVSQGVLQTSLFTSNRHLISRWCIPRPHREQLRALQPSLFLECPSVKTEGRDLCALAAELGEGVSPEGSQLPGSGLKLGPSLASDRDTSLPSSLLETRASMPACPPTYFGCLGLANWWGRGVLWTFQGLVRGQVSLLCFKVRNSIKSSLVELIVPDCPNGTEPTTAPQASCFNVGWEHVCGTGLWRGGGGE